MENENENKVYPGIRQEIRYITADLKEFESPTEAMSHIVDLACEKLINLLKSEATGGTGFTQTDLYKIVKTVFPNYYAVVEMKNFLNKNLIIYR